MEEKLKQRLVGAAVVISLGVIFLPMILDGGRHTEFEKVDIQIPPVPQIDYSSTIEPLTPAKPELRSAPRRDDLSIEKITKSYPAKKSLEKVPVAAPPALDDELAELLKPIEAPDEVVSKDGVDLTKTAVKTSDKAKDKQKPVQKIVKKTAEPEKTKPVTNSANGSQVTAWVVQVGSFSSRKNAIELRDRLRKQGFASFVESFDAEGKASHRVRIGPESNRARADRSLAELQRKLKLSGIVVSYP